MYTPSSDSYYEFFDNMTDLHFSGTICHLCIIQRCKHEEIQSQILKTARRHGLGLDMLAGILPRSADGISKFWIRFVKVCKQSRKGLQKLMRRPKSFDLCREAKRQIVFYRWLNNMKQKISIAEQVNSNNHLSTCIHILE